MVSGLKQTIKTCIGKVGLLPLFYPRIRLAGKYLSGSGVEIGALAAPLKLPRNASAKYIDIATREESIRKFPELNPNDIVKVDYISNGFTLAGVPSSQFDFLIANHVLEHSPDPIGTLVQWHRVLKPRGMLFVALPTLEDCFDCGRQLTPYQHMLDDYEIACKGRFSELVERNKSHYREWLAVSEPAILKRPALPPDQAEKRIQEMADKQEEIHFHTFNMESVKEVFSRLSTTILPGLGIMEIVADRNEIIIIAKK